VRIRTIKPEFWTPPIMGRLEPDVRLLALALLNYSDDEGYFLADPLLVRGACCPFVDESSKVRRWLDRLTVAGWIELSGETPHGRIGRVVNFAEHQKIDRAKPSTISPYWIDDESTIDRRLIDDASLLEGKGKEQGTGKGTGNAREGFDEFWQAYPRKEGKEAARKAWPKAASELPAILAALEWQRASDAWRDPQFIPHGSTYLNGRRWEDDPAGYKRTVQHPGLDESRIARGRTAADYAAAIVKEGDVI